MRDVAGHEDQIERTFARHLVRDVDIAAPCVPCLGRFTRRVWPRVICDGKAKRLPPKKLRSRSCGRGGRGTCSVRLQVSVHATRTRATREGTPSPPGHRQSAPRAFGKPSTAPRGG